MQTQDHNSRNLRWDNWLSGRHGRSPRFATYRCEFGVITLSVYPYTSAYLGQLSLGCNKKAPTFQTCVRRLLHQPQRSSGQAWRLLTPIARWFDIAFLFPKLVRWIWLHVDEKHGLRDETGKDRRPRNHKVNAHGVYDSESFGKINKNVTTWLPRAHDKTFDPWNSDRLIYIVLGLLHPNVSVKGAKTQPSWGIESFIYTNDKTGSIKKILYSTCTAATRKGLFSGHVHVSPPHFLLFFFLHVELTISENAG